MRRLDTALPPWSLTPREVGEKSREKVKGERLK
jgi:hypothetical protein